MAERWVLLAGGGGGGGVFSPGCPQGGQGAVGRAPGAASPECFAVASVAARPFLRAQVEKADAENVWSVRFEAAPASRWGTGGWVWAVTLQCSSEQLCPPLSGLQVQRNEGKFGSSEGFCILLA